jgi:hypothetical protein
VDICFRLHGTHGFAAKDRYTAWGCFLSHRPRHATVAKGATRMSTLIGVLITFVVIILVLYLVNMLPIDGRAKQIVQIIVIIIGILSLLKYLAVF